MFGALGSESVLVTANLVPLLAIARGKLLVTYAHHWRQMRLSLYVMNQTALVCKVGALAKVPFIWS